MVTTHIHVFGPLRIVEADVGLTTRGLDGRKPRQVLQLLAAHARPVSKDRLVDLLWPTQPPVDPRGAVEHYVAVLRRYLERRSAVGGAVVRTEAAGYALDLDLVSVDLVDFTRAVADLTTWVSLDRVRDALQLSDAEPFADEPDAAWACDVRTDVAARRCDLLVRAAELGLAYGDPVTAARDAADAIATEPHLESAHRVLIAAHYVHGDQARALTVYQSLRRRLVAELGVEPTPHTQSVHDAVLRHSRPADILRRLTVPPGLRSA